MHTQEAQQQAIAIIPSAIIEEMKNTIGLLAKEVREISSTLQEIKNPQEIAIPQVHELTEIFLSDLAKAKGVSKQTIVRHIKESKLPKPQKKPHNNYLFWYKKDLPKELHSKIDFYYFDKARASR